MSSPTSGGGSAKFPSREKLGRLSPGTPSGRAAPPVDPKSVENEQEKDDNVEPPSKEVPETTDKEETNADNLETTQATVDGSKAEDAEKQSLEASLSTNSY
ncbi:hypothetical protein H0E87_011382 [Populus deltoides]|uniref:Uncharacterized protein n=1 Tax=Populus deltoides TaxID=3696 RepID=A0A8T2YWT4_POPDE|nr:hypothetical protein H0E87_011382 [Populus deltoides]